MGCYFLPQGTFLTHGSNPHLLHCRQILYQLSHQGSPYLAVTQGKSSLLFPALKETKSPTAIAQPAENPTPEALNSITSSPHLMGAARLICFSPALTLKCHPSLPALFPQGNSVASPGVLPVGATPGQVSMATSSRKGGLRVANTGADNCFLDHIHVALPHKPVTTFQRRPRHLRPCLPQAACFSPDSPHQAPLLAQAQGRGLFRLTPPPPGREAQGPLLWAPEHPRA